MVEELFTEEEIKEEICRVMSRLYRRGLISAVGGNVSAKIPGSREFWITPSGIFKGELTVDDLVKVDLDGNVVEGFLKPSVETPLHRAVYRKRLDVNAVVHAHNPVATGLALAGISIEPITVEAVVTLRRVPIVPFVYPGTEDLAEAVAEHIAGVRALILQNHGVLGVGFNLVEAETVVETLEEVATAQWVAYHFGKPRLIPEKDMELVRKLYGI
ncbi:MAG: class II aldolase/adducin family protein [Candidatus Bathyarchaeota archaeon B26-2]|nr:MAG: class II aldolase/adducin family protein [Candidatus Bathyarchaeota archaeon B26-2]